MMRSKFIFLAICFICLLLIPNFVFGIVDASKSYRVGVEAYENGDFKKAVHFLESAIEAGLSSNELNDSYCKLYFCAFELKDQKNMAKYESLCSNKNLTIHITFKGLESGDVKNLLLIEDILKKRLARSAYKKHSVKAMKMGNRIIYIVSIFKANNPDRAIELITKKGKLKLALIDEENSLSDALKGNIPKGSKIIYKIKRRNHNVQKMPFLVKSEMCKVKKAYDPGSEQGTAA